MRAVVYRNRGWWVADCPRPDCEHAEFFGVSQRGEFGGLTPEYMICPECGGHWPALWPSPELRRGVEQLLADRPKKHQNWITGETLADLLWENATHGITPTPAALEGQPDGLLLAVDSVHGVTHGAREIGASQRLSIAGGQ